MRDIPVQYNGLVQRALTPRVLVRFQSTGAIIPETKYISGIFYNKKNINKGDNVNNNKSKGEIILPVISKHFNNKQFSAKDLSNFIGEKISGNTLSSLAKKGFLKKIENTSPVEYNFVTDDADEAFAQMDGVFSIEDIVDWKEWDSFSLKDMFSLLGELIPQKEQEKLIWKPFQSSVDEIEGIVYAFVLKNSRKLYKIGKTDTTLKDRITSYNCGKTSYRKNGTCSVTNYKVLQSLLNIEEPVEVYGYIPPKAQLTFNNKTVLISCSPSKYIEGYILEAATQWNDGNKLPGCIQN